MIVLLGFPHLELDGNLWIEPDDLARFEIAAGLKSEAVVAFHQRPWREQMAQAPIAIGCALAQLLPLAVRVLDFKNHGNARSGTANRNIKHVCGYLAHLGGAASNFSSRMRVILRCSSAAMWSSVCRSFDNRQRRFSKISSAVLPAAQIKKMFPNFSA